MSKLVPIVAIVGRANVGKSSLYNAILGRREAVTAKEAGTTRDSISSLVSYGGRDFWLVDTAGLKTADDDFEQTIQQQVTQAAAAADAIWVVVEAGSGPGVEDRTAAKLALKTKKPVTLVVNKSDNPRHVVLEHWNKLGIKSIFATSATQKRGIDELLAATAELVKPVKSKPQTQRTSVTIVGRPNVGKSALFNALCAKQQAVVSERAGTTRDVNRQIIRFHGQEIELADTAGIRRSGRIERGAEAFSVLRTLSAIEQSDIVFLVTDAREPSVQLDQKIASMAKEAGKGLIIIVNKWDLAKELELDKERLTRTFVSDFAFTPWAPLVFISSTVGLNVGKLLELVSEINRARAQVIAEPELNRWLKEATGTHPPAGRGQFLPKLTRIAQEPTNDPPSFKVFGSRTSAIHFSYRRYLERSFRERWPLIGTPIKFWFINKELK